VEALSVMLQVIWAHKSVTAQGADFENGTAAPSLKADGKETQVVVRSIITMLLCLVGLSTLKLR
jgi:UDP-N-acetylmuramyl pentapeptide phosphotransferase/UDP-N-acetylglucosamine-1-phosphate transferase